MQHSTTPEPSSIQLQNSLRQLIDIAEEASSVFNDTLNAELAADNGDFEDVRVLGETLDLLDAAIKSAANILTPES